MPKAILEFTLPGEATDHAMAVKGSRYYSALWSFQEQLRELRNAHPADSSIETVEILFQDCLGEVGVRSLEAAE